MKVLLIVIFLVKSSISIESHLGSCPAVNPIVSSARANLSGLWYDIMKYPSIFVRGKCISFELEELHDEIMITSREHKDDEIVNMTRRGKVHNDGSFEFDFSFLKFSARFYILDTDYKNYLVVFGCKNIAYMMNLQMAFIWGREKELDEKYKRMAFEALIRNKISTNDLQKSEQSSCH